MNKIEKELLLKDICARLPYKLKCFIYTIRADGKKENWVPREVTTTLINLFVENNDYGIAPYLRQMSSMTEEEKKEYASFIGGQKPFDSDFYAYPKEYRFIYEHDVTNYIEWLISHHFDYRGLIEKGLAIEAPYGMYE